MSIRHRAHGVTAICRVALSFLPTWSPGSADKAWRVEDPANSVVSPVLVPPHRRERNGLRRHPPLGNHHDRDRPSSSR